MVIEIFSGSKLLGGLAALLGSAVMPPDPAAVRPIMLLAEPAGDAVHIRVIGRSDMPFDARYTLEASGGPRGGTNRSVQGGTARLQPGAAVTLISLTLGNVTNGSWSAKLRVEPSTGGSYEQSAGS